MSAAFSAIPVEYLDDDHDDNDYSKGVAALDSVMKREIGKLHNSYGLVRYTSFRAHRPRKPKGTHLPQNLGNQIGVHPAYPSVSSYRSGKISHYHALC